MPAPADCSIDPRRGLGFFTGTWVVAAVASTVVIATFADSTDDVSIAVLGASAAVAWTVYAVGSWMASTRAGSGDVRVDLGLRAAPVDALGVPIGVAAQLVLVPLVYAPLRVIWPETFDEQALTETADELVDRAGGATMILLALVVVIGAPLAEELFYRGLLQRPLLTAAPPAIVIVGVAALFAVIHFRPVEYPGLFAAGLVFGVCAWITGRLAMPVVAHVAFNATALALAAA